VTSGWLSKWVYIPVGMYSRILSSVVQPVELGETTGHTSRILGNPASCCNTCAVWVQSNVYGSYQERYI